MTFQGDVKTTYLICFVDSDTGRSTLEDYRGSGHARFDDRLEAEYVLAKLQKTYPCTKWEIREVPETYWSAKLKGWVTGSLVAPM
jgi:hypothetical protein